MTLLIPTDASLQDHEQKITSVFVPDLPKLESMLKSFMFSARLKKKKLLEQKSSPPEDCNKKPCTIRVIKDEIVINGNKLSNSTDIKCLNGIVHEICEAELPNG
jgi:hypothetical protein